MHAGKPRALDTADRLARPDRVSAELMDVPVVVVGRRDDASMGFRGKKQE